MQAALSSLARTGHKRMSAAKLFRWYQEVKRQRCMTHCLPLERGIKAIRLPAERRGYGKVVIIPT